MGAPHEPKDAAEYLAFLRDLPERAALDRVRAIVHLPRAVIEVEGRRGIDLLSVAANEGVEVRAIEDSIIPVEHRGPPPVVVTLRPCADGEVEHVEEGWRHVVLVYQPDLTAAKMVAHLAEPLGRYGLVVEVSRVVDAFEIVARPAECHVYLSDPRPPQPKRRPGPPPRAETAADRARRWRREGQ